MIYYLVAGGLGVALTALASYLKGRVSYLQGPLLRGHLSSLKASWLVYLLLGIAAAMPLFLLSALRYDVGTDYFSTYCPFFERVAREGLGPWNPSVELGFSLLVQFIVTLGGGPTWMFLISSAVIVGFFFAGIYGLSEIPWYSVALFILTECYFISMNGVRQFMGIAILFFGYRFIRKPCFWKFALCVLAASLFHMSCLIFLPIYFISKLPVLPVVGVGVVVLITSLNTWLYKLAGFLVGLTPYRIYWESGFHSSTQFYPSHLLVNVLVLVLLVYFCNKGDNAASPLFRFLFYGELILLLLLMNHNLLPLATRLCWFFEAGHLLLIPLLAKSEPRKGLRYFILAAVAVAWGVVCYQEIFVLGYHEVTPYQTILSVWAAG